MKNTITVVENGYYGFSNTLDVKIYNLKYDVYTIDLKLGDLYITFETDEYETKWGGNNPFCKSECMRYFINKEDFVEIYLNEYESFILSKVLQSSSNTTSELLMKLSKLDDVYRILESELNIIHMNYFLTKCEEKIDNQI